MINISSETILSFADAVRILPKRRAGKHQKSQHFTDGLAWGFVALNLNTSCADQQDAARAKVYKDFSTP